jgi:hypothetical protein
LATLKAHHDPLGHRLQQPRIPCIHLHPIHPPKKPVLASVPTPDGAQMSYIANVNELSISQDGGQPAGQYFPARPKRQRRSLHIGQPGQGKIMTQFVSLYDAKTHLSALVDRQRPARES